MSYAKQSLLVSTLVFLALMTSASTGFNSTESEDATVRLPEPGSGEAHVGPGEALYSERHQRLVKTYTTIAVLSEEFILGRGKRVRVSAGTRLGNYFLTNPNQPIALMRCSPSHTLIKQAVFGGRIFKKAACFAEKGGVLVPFFFKGYGPEPSPNLRLEYELIREETDSRLEKSGRFELLYQGAGGGVLRLTYREFTASELARPAFTQEVSYDLDPEGPTDIIFKGASIRVLSADNLGIRFTVNSPFEF